MFSDTGTHMWCLEISSKMKITMLCTVGHYPSFVYQYAQRICGCKHAIDMQRIFAFLAILLIVLAEMIMRTLKTSSLLILQWSVT